MAGINGVLGTQTFTEKTVVSDNHPPVVRNMEALADNGTIEAGTILSKNADGKIISCDFTASDGTEIPAGVLVQTIDTSADTMALVLVHGTVVRAALMSAGEASADAQVSALESALKIWAI
jgi:hypothetical protein